MQKKIDKIFYIAHSRFPNEKAHGIQLAKMCEAFKKSGVDVELVVPRKRDQIQDNPFEFYGLGEKFSIKRLWTIDMAPSTAFGFFLSSFVFGWSVFFYLWPRKKDGILYSIDLDPLSFLGLIFLGRSYFFEMHGPKKKTPLNYFLFRRINGVFAINEAVKAALISNFPFLQNKILLCPNGVDLEEDINLDQSTSRRKLGIQNNTKAVVYTGSFQNWKGLETIIGAAERLRAADFYLVGGLKEEIALLKDRESLPDNLHFIGRRSYKEMPFWRSAADLLVVTGTKKDHYSYCHTSPMKLFEYLAAKRPIIASRTPAIEQIVSEREVFFHEPDDPEDLARKIKYVLDHRDEAIKKAEAAYLKAREYSWGNRAKTILDFISNHL